MAFSKGEMSALRRDLVVLEREERLVCEEQEANRLERRALDARANYLSQALASIRRLLEVC